MKELLLPNILNIIGKLPLSIKTKFDTAVHTHCDALCSKSYPIQSFDVFVSKRTECFEKCEDTADLIPNTCIVWVGADLLKKYDINQWSAFPGANPALYVNGTDRTWERAAKQIYNERAVKFPNIVSFDTWKKRLGTLEHLVDFYFPLVAKDHAEESWTIFDKCITNQLARITEDNIIPQTDRPYLSQCSS